VHRFWSVLFGVTMFAAFALFPIAWALDWAWLPKNVSSFGHKIDNLFYMILFITGFFFVLTEALLVYFMWVYASDPSNPRHVFGHHAAEKKVFWTSFFKSAFRPVTTLLHNQHRVEMAWTAVPAVILLFIALVQVRTWADIKYPEDMPPPDQFVEVNARQFEWRMRYPTAGQLDAMTGAWKSNDQKPAVEWATRRHADDTFVVSEVHTWQGANTRVFLKTQDVIHSFYLPNLRLKQDALPGKVIPVWFRVLEANTVANGDRWEDGNGRDPKTGKPNNPEQVWDLVCAELCGWGHYKMQGRLYVHKDKSDYLAWLAVAQREQNRHQPERH